MGKITVREGLWAKIDGKGTTYPLLLHLLDVGTCAGVLWDTWLRDGLKDLLGKQMGNQAPQMLQLVCALHDVGKANPYFLTQFFAEERTDALKSVEAQLNELGYRVPLARDLRLPDKNVLRKNTILRRHEKLSALINNELHPFYTEPAAEHWVSLAVMGHHGRFEFTETKPMFNQLKNAVAFSEKQAPQSWSAIWDELIYQVEDAFGIKREELPLEMDTTCTILLSGLVILADRIASTDASVDAGVTLQAQLMKQGTVYGATNQSPDATLQTQDTPVVTLPVSAQEWVSMRRAALEKLVKETVGTYNPFSDAQKEILDQHCPNSMQDAATASTDDLLCIMAPTGSGKTEAALLRHAQRDERLIFLLPTQATSNALLHRLQKIFKHTSNVASLAHAMASLDDFYAHPVLEHNDARERSAHGPLDDIFPQHEPVGLYPSDFVKAGSSRLLAPVCVGTIDQALMASLPKKWTHVRLLALANAHVVIDEVHTLEAYQSKLLEPILNWLGATGTRVTLLSATIPQFQVRDLLGQYQRYLSSDLHKTAPGEKTACFASDLQETAVAYPEMIGVSAAGISHEPLVEPERHLMFDVRPAVAADQMADEHVAWALLMHKQYPQARLGIIVNTIDRAVAVTQGLVRNKVSVITLHSRMTSAHRTQVAQRLEEELGPNGTGKGLVVVGTQAIEASLDIDLDMLSTELAPAPSLIQRLGRVWRRKDPLRRARGLEAPIATQLVCCHEKRGALPYARAELRRVLRFLEEHPTIVLPDEGQSFIDTAAVSYEDLASDDEDVVADTTNEMAGIVSRYTAALNQRINLPLLFEPGAESRCFDLLTSKWKLKEDEENPETRFIEREQYKIICRGNQPFCWQGTKEELEAIKSPDRTKISQALACIIPVGGGLLKQMQKDEVLEKLAAQSALLSNVFIVNLDESDSYKYDSIVGLVRENALL